MKKRLLAAVLGFSLLLNASIIPSYAITTEELTPQTVSEVPETENVVTQVVYEHLDFEYSTEAGQDPGDVLGGIVKGSSTLIAPTPSDDRVYDGNYSLKIVGNEADAKFFGSKGYGDPQEGKIFSVWVYDDNDPDRFITFKLTKGTDTSSEAYTVSFGIQGGNYRAYTTRSTGGTILNKTVQGSEYDEGWHQFTVDYSVAGKVDILVDGEVIGSQALSSGDYGDFTLMSFENGSTSATRYPAKGADVYIDDIMVTESAPVPSAPVVDDNMDTLSFTYADSKTNPADYEYSIDGGVNFEDCLKNPIYIGNIDVAVGDVVVRAKAPDGADYTFPVITNDTAFTSNVNIDLSMEREEDLTNFNMLVNIPPEGTKDPATVPPELSISTDYSRSGISSMLIIPDGANIAEDNSGLSNKGGLYRIGNTSETLIEDKVLTIWVYDDLSITDNDHKMMGYTEELDASGTVVSKTFVGFSNSVNDDYYVVRSSPGAATDWSTWGLTSVQRTEGWHSYQWDYTVEGECNIYIDGVLVRTFASNGLSNYYLQDTWSHSGVDKMSYYVDDITITNSREEVPVVPEAPTAPVTDDENNTFGFTPVEGKEELSLYEYSIDGGKTFNDVTANPQPVSTQLLEVGTVMLRLKATDTEQSGMVLRNDVRFTDPADVVKDKIHEEIDFITYSNPKDYTVESWKVLETAIANAETAMETNTDLQSAYDAILNAMDMLEFADIPFVEYTFADEVVPVPPVYGVPDWSEDGNISHLTEKSYKIRTEEVDGRQVAQFTYNFPKALEDKKVVFYHYADYTGSGWFEITFGNSEDGTGQVLSCYTSSGSVSTYYQLYDLVDGEKVNGRSTGIRRRNDIHKFEINMTNGNGTQFYFDTNLISSLVNLDSIDYIDITVSKTGESSYISLDDISISHSNPVTDISLPVDTVELGYRDTYEINHINNTTTTKYDSYGTTDKISYTSADPTIAYVTAGGSIQPMKPGQTTVTVKSTSGVTETINVIVKDFMVESVGISESIITVDPNFVTEYAMEKNSIKVFNAIIEPANATNLNKTWTSSDESIATVIDGEVTTYGKKGTATITVTTEDGNYKSSVVITVADEAYNYGAEVFVATNGNDFTGDGTIENPYASIERARDDLRAHSDVVDGGAVVYFREGSYFVSEGIMLEIQDSGTADSPVEYKAYNDEKVQFTGGATLNATDFELVSDSEDLLKIQDYAENQVYVADISDYLGDEKLDIMAKGYFTPYPANLVEDAGYNTTTQYYSVTFGNELLTLARWPNVDETYGSYEHTGYAKFDTIPYKGNSIRDWLDDQIGRPNYVQEDERDIFDAFTFTSTRLTDRMESWYGVAQDGSNILDLDIWYEGYTSVSYTTQSSPIRSITSNGVVQSELACTYWARVDPNTRFYVYNLLQELDIPGEWYIDKDAEKLYLIPPTGTDMTDPTNTVSFGTLGETMFTLTDTKHITIENVELTNTVGPAFEVYGGNNNTLSRSTISNSAGDAGGVWDSENEKAMNNGLEYCLVKDVNGGFTLGGETYYEEFVHTFNFVNGCTFDNYQTLTTGFNPAVVLHGVGNYVSSCEIMNSPNNAIMWQGNDNVIEFNEIHHVVLETHDTSAIYTGRNVLHRGTVVKNNYFHSLGSEGDYTSGNQAVYLDDLSSGILVYDNVFEDVFMGVFINGGQDNYIFDNEFRDCEYGVLATDWAYMGMAYWLSHGYGTKQDPSTNIPVDVDWAAEDSAYAKYHNVTTLFEGDDHQNALYNKIIDNYVTSDTDDIFEWFEYRLREVQPNAKAVISDWYFDKNNNFMID